MTTKADQREEAKFQQKTIAQYREWLSYIEASLTLITIQRAAATATQAFEATESTDDAKLQATASIRGLDPKQRALFEAVREQDRLRVQQDMEQDQARAGSAGSMLDPDEVTERVLVRLLSDARGETTPDGRGLMPYGVPADIKWYAISRDILDAVPTADAYRVGTKERSPLRRMLLPASAAALMVVVAIVLIINANRPAKAQGTTGRTFVGNEEISAWPIVAVMGTAHNGESWTIPAQPALTAADWPKQEAHPTSFWQSGAVRPIRMCIPGNLLAGSTSIILVAQEAPRRVFTFGTNDPDAVDIVVQACPGTPSADPRTGMLKETAPQPMIALGQAQYIPDGTAIAAQAMTTTSRNEDDTLPVGSELVRVTVVCTQTLDWPALAPTILIPDGSAILPSTITPGAGSVELQYLLPVLDHAIPVVFSLRASEHMPLLRWRTTLPMPKARAQLIHDTFTITDVLASQSEDNGQTMHVQATFKNNTQQPFAIATSDFILTASENRLVVLNTPTQRTVIPPGVTTPITVVAPISSGATTLQIGTARYQIAP